jgi:hypothetical protein
MDGKKRLGSPLDANKEKEQRMFSPDPHFRGGTDAASLTSAASAQSASFRRDTEGAMRDTFLVDILKVDGEPFKGTVARTEALKHIFVKALGFKPDEFHGATPGFRGNPTVLFKTKEIFNIDEKLAGKSFFSYQKIVKTEEGEKIVKMSCSIRGIREQDPAMRAGPSYTWLKIEGAEYHLKEEQLRLWLSEYGLIVSDITEDKEELRSNSSEDEEIYNDIDLNTGIYSAKMSLIKPIPQMIPMCGKKIKIYHKGIKKQCMKCFGTGHFKRDCREERKEWLDYVDSFMLEAKLPDEYYGNWTRLVEDWRFKNKEKHDANRNSQFETDEQQELEKEERNQSIEEISRILRDQREKASTRKMPEHLEEEPIDELGAMSIAANSNPFAILAAESNVTSQMEKRQTKKPKRGVGDGRGRAKGFLSLQGSPTDTPQSETQDE